MPAPMCLREEESVDHLMLNCRIAQALWTAVVGWFGCSCVFRESIIELIQAWKTPIRALRGKEMWRLSFRAVF